MLADYWLLKRKTVLAVKSSFLCFMMTCISLISSASGAHVLEETSAKVLFRDGQVELQILTDMEKWQVKLSSNLLWLVGEIEEVMPADLSAEDKAQFLQNALLNQLELIVNEQVVDLSVDLLSGIVSSDHHMATIILRGELDSLEVDKVSVTFPKSLGPVHVSFLHPQYRLTPAGQPVTVKMN